MGGKACWSMVVADSIICGLEVYIREWSGVLFEAVIRLASEI